MARLTLPERLRIAAIGAERTRRGVVSAALNSRTLRWRYGAPRADQLLIVPQDLRTADPSFWFEMTHGQFGLGGSLARLDGNSPFDVVPPSQPWARSLHGFGWLRHLHAAAEPEAAEAARQLAVEWSIRNARGQGDGWRPEVLARRVISWLSHAGLLLEGADEATYNAISSSLGMQLVRLASAWREAADGQPRLLALTALVFADLCIAGRDRQLEGDVRKFLEELDRQILPDGGHASRNCAVLVDLLLDLLPLAQCFRARGHVQPARLTDAIAAMLAMARFMRLGDGMLARFNGVAVAFPSRLATVLAYSEANAAQLSHAEASGYERLERGDTVLIADCGGPPPLVLSAEAHAGCLSFEMSCGQDVVFSNGGAPGSADGDWRPASRATASHNTLVLAETSSSRLVSHRRIEDILGDLPIRGPATVEATAIEAANEGTGFEAMHDGYLEQFGLLHQRRIMLDTAGRRVDGVDRLKPPRGVMRLKQDLPFAIHFHLSPQAECRRGDKIGTAIVEVGEQRWRFAVEGARLGIEESMYFANSAGPVRRLQIVLRATTFGETEVRWAITRLA